MIVCALHLVEVRTVAVVVVVVAIGTTTSAQTLGWKTLNMCSFTKPRLRRPVCASL